MHWRADVSQAKRSAHNSQDKFDDPSFRTRVDLMVEFQVLSEMEEDDDEPDTELSYLAENDDETCQMETDDPACDEAEWWIRIRMQDQDSGLNRIQVAAGKASANANDYPIYYRYENFPVGTDKEYEVILGMSCCLEGVEVRVEDVAGNRAKVEAENGGTGTPMSKGLKWGLIGAAIAILLILIGVGVFCCWRRNAGYSNP